MVSAKGSSCRQIDVGYRGTSPNDFLNCSSCERKSGSSNSFEAVTAILPSTAKRRMPRRTTMKMASHDAHQMLGLTSKPPWAQTWHIWSVIIPRNSITGRLVWGRVLRRHDGRRWIYKTTVVHAPQRSR
jgi:hypothetical protein